jgi:ubiquinone biosynthesis monooxygenase Coq7
VTRAPTGSATAAVPAPSSTLGNRILKVNHAGENGAVHIYAGQLVLARWTAPALVPELLEFQTHELRHRNVFEAELARRGQRRCRSYWLCGAGGYLLGLLTGLLGKSAIAATTVAVEAVVLRHLQEQLTTLATLDPPAVSAIASIVEDEQQHHDSAALQAQAGAFWPRILRPIVSASTECVIWLGMKL